MPDARWKVLAGGGGGASGGGGRGAATTEQQQRPSREALSSMRASQLQALLRERGVYFGDCFDKQSLLDRAREAGVVGGG